VEVAGLDAAEASLVIARERTPHGDFRVGEMETIPWTDHAFDAVTSFNAFQFAADAVNALREAKRVVKPEGCVGIVVWGREEDCETMTATAAVSKLTPPPTNPSGTSLLAPGRIETLLAQAGLTLLSSGEMDCFFEFPDQATALRELMAAGIAVAAARQVGAKAVRQAIAESLLRFRTNEGRYCQRNQFHYFIARP
jgi:SAM-dependent methyltransferase